MRYCSHCFRELTTNQPDCFLNEGGEECRNRLDWCDHCRDVVEISNCSVPYWTVTATLGLLCWVQM